MIQLIVVYKLPDLLPAPTSDIGLLARRLIEYADLSVVRPLLQALEDARRDEDLQRFKFSLRVHCINFIIHGKQRRGWELPAVDLLEVFWFDIFDLTESLAALEGRIRPPKFSDAMALADRTYRAGDTIHAGQLFTMDENGNAVPVTPAPSVAAAGVDHGTS